MKKKIIVIVSVVALLGIGGFFVIKPFNNSKAQVETAPVVKVDKVAQKEVVTSIDVDGVVAFRNKISIYAENSGKVLSVPVKEADDISKGDVIINYDKTTLDTAKRQLEEAKLGLKSAKLGLNALYIPADESQLIQLETQVLQSQKSIDDIKTNISQLEEKLLKAQTDFENAKKLYTQGAIALNDLTNFEDNLKNLQDQMESLKSNLNISNQQLEANKKQYETAKNKTNDPNNKNRIESQKVSVEQAELRVKQLEKDINDFKTNILSPEDGTITKVYVKDGENIAEGKVVAEMGNLNDIIIQAYVPEYDMKGVKEGQKVSIKSESLNQTFEGNITKVYPLAEKMTISGSEKSVVKIEISVPQNSGLKVGYTVKLNITTNVEKDALVIPIMAYMTETNEDPYIFIVKEDGTLEKRRIKLKSFQNSLVSVEGVSVGETVVSSPTENMTEGMKISPTQQEATQPNIVIPGAVTGSLENENLDTL